MRRCSNRGAYTADMISKGNMRELRRMMPLREDPCEVPQSIVSWVTNPRMDLNWSKAILKELRGRGLAMISPY